MLDEQTPSPLRLPESLSPADWEVLRSKSLRPGGFGDDRVKYWPKLLNVVLPEDDQQGTAPIPEQTAEHQDERQIGLDTDRSFVLYPVEERQDKDALQAGLHQLLVSFFRKRPKMSYFQGYHDIISVLFLTLPKELHLPCAEKLSLHRLRDSMGSGLEPVLGLLRITKSLLRLADPEYANLLESTSPLPFYALSNLLTLFSHDTPTLPLIQHIFDYLFCRPPIASVYLTVVILLSRKEDVLRLHEEDEEGMIHSLLSSFPLLEDRPVDIEDSHKPPASPSNKVPPSDRPSINTDPTPTEHDRPTTPTPKAEDQAGFIEATHARAPKLESRPESVVTQSDDVHTPTPLAFDDHETTSECVTPDLPSVALGRASDQTSVKHDSSHAINDDRQRPADAVEDALTAPTHPNKGTCDPLKADDARVEGYLDSAANPPSASTDVFVADQDEKAYLEAIPPPSPNMVLQLSDLLRQADQLYSQFPPTHPSLGIPSIMGPQSVVFTWSENPSLLPSDNTAEAMVTHPELVVYPYVEPAPAPDSKEKDESMDEKGATPRKHHRWRRRGASSGPFGQVEKRTAAVVASAAVVLAVAVTVYGIRSRPGPDRMYLSWLSVFY